MNIDRISCSGSLPDLLFEENLIQPGIVNGMNLRCLLSLIDHTTSQNQDQRLKFLSELTAIFTDCCTIQRTAGNEDSQLQRLLRIINHKPEKWWDCREMAEFCHVSEVHLRRIFKKETGMSPKLYLDYVKMSYAGDLLRKGFSVGVVSELLGYSDQFHFSRRFKAILGMSPRDFLSQ